MDSFLGREFRLGGAGKCGDPVPDRFEGCAAGAVSASSNPPRTVMAGNARCVHRQRGD